MYIWPFLKVFLKKLCIPLYLFSIEVDLRWCSRNGRYAKPPFLHLKKNPQQKLLGIKLAEKRFMGKPYVFYIYAKGKMSHFYSFAKISQ